jgi:hypothetical protein
MIKDHLLRVDEQIGLLERVRDGPGAGVEEQGMGQSGRAGVAGQSLYLGLARVVRFGLGGVGVGCLGWLL